MRMKSVWLGFCVAATIAVLAMPARASGKGDVWISGPDSRNARKIYRLTDAFGGMVFVGETVGREKFLLRRIGPKRVDIDVFIHGRLRLRAPDQAVVFDDLNCPAGDTQQRSYDFYLSRNRTMLFVVRDICNETCVSYLYVAAGHGVMRPVKPFGLPFYRAVVQCYAHAAHIHNPDFGLGARNAEFVRWTKNGLIFWTAAATYHGMPGPRDLSRYWNMSFDFRTRRLRVLPGPSQRPPGAVQARQNR
jgi:hypothetical protein